MKLVGGKCPAVNARMLKPTGIPTAHDLAAAKIALDTPFIPRPSSLYPPRKYAPRNHPAMNGSAVRSVSASKTGNPWLNLPIAANKINANTSPAANNAIRPHFSIREAELGLSN
uniref:Uncharacterized protein n=1 Tax=Opuntia streptacantha TaxID=393608 RepID=A0A7C9D5Z2_OPUST